MRPLYLSGFFILFHVTGRDTRVYSQCHKFGAGKRVAAHHVTDRGSAPLKWEEVYSIGTFTVLAVESYQLKLRQKAMHIKTPSYYVIRSGVARESARAKAPR